MTGFLHAAGSADMQESRDMWKDRNVWTELLADRLKYRSIDVWDRNRGGGIICWKTHFQKAARKGSYVNAYRIVGSLQSSHSSTAEKANCYSARWWPAVEWPTVESCTTAAHGGFEARRQLLSSAGPGHAISL